MGAVCRKHRPRGENGLQSLPFGGWKPTIDPSLLPLRQPDGHARTSALLGLDLNGSAHLVGHSLKQRQAQSGALVLPATPSSARAQTGASSASAYSSTPASSA